MKPILLLALPLLSMACGGTMIIVESDAASDDGSSSDAAADSPPQGDGSPDGGGGLFCNGLSCALTYCIHPTQYQACPMCVGTPDAGYCPPPSHPGFCGGPPIFDGGQQCVVDPPPPGPPYCSDIIPPGCLTPFPASGDVYCQPVVCAAQAYGNGG